MLLSKHVRIVVLVSLILKFVSEPLVICITVNMPLKLSLQNYILRTTFGYCICLVMIGLPLLGIMNAVRSRLYFLSTIAHLRKCRNVGSIWYMRRTRKSQTKELHNAAVAVSFRGGARIFCLGGPNFVTNILVSSQDKPSHSGINAHTQI